MIKIKKVFLVIFLILIVSLMLIPTNVYAALQSNGSEPAKKGLEDWLLQIRQMQSAGGTLRTIRFY